MASAVKCSMLSRARYVCHLLLWMLTLQGGGGGLWGRGSGGVLAQVGCDWEVAGGRINLKSLASSDGNARFKDIKGQQGSSQWYYSWNPCKPFSEGKCSNVAVCQRDESKSRYYNCGDPGSAKEGTDGVDRAIVYTSVDVDRVPRTSHVALVCNPKATTPEFIAKGDLSNGDYHFVLKSVCCCPGGCSGGFDTESGGLSVGTILVIVVLALFVVYMIGGVAVNKARAKSGAELIPNVTFWQSAPGLVKTGFLFTFGKLSGRSSYEKI